MSANFTIERCPPQQRPDALRVLHAGLPPEQQIALVQALHAERDQNESAFDGLLAASAEDEVVGAAWCQLAPGRTAVMWLPAADSPAAIGLMQSAAKFLDEHQIVLAQLLATSDDSISAELLSAADFQKLARLAYLSIDSDLLPGDQPPSRLGFAANASAHPQRLGELLLRTYRDSLDCPQLNGVRSPDDVLDGYRQQGTFSPERWYFVRHKDRDVGALILTEHVETHNWELVYMGLVPEARGHAFGSEMLNFAMWQAGTQNAQRLVLAVDEANQPALDTYTQAGFTAWDHRTVFARLRP